MYWNAYSNDPVFQGAERSGGKTYVEQAYPINKRSAEETETKKERLKSEKGIRYMQAFMVKNNKRFEERK